MANYFYTDAKGQKQGPVSRDQLIELATLGDIEHASVVETDTGDRESAEYFIPSTCFKRAKAPLAVAEPSPGIFDIRFTRFVMNFYIPYIWVLTIIVCFLGWAFSVVLGVNQLATEREPMYGIAAILMATIAVPFSLLFSRMVLEVVIVLFRIETHLRTIRDHYEKK